MPSALRARPPSAPATRPRRESRADRRPSWESCRSSARARSTRPTGRGPACPEPTDSCWEWWRRTAPGSGSRPRRVRGARPTCCSGRAPRSSRCPSPARRIDSSRVANGPILDRRRPKMWRWKRHHDQLALAACTVIALTCAGAHVPLPILPAVETTNRAELAARGRYIVRDVSVCGHCHAADPKRDVDGPLIGGWEFRDWRIGTARAANLTPDDATGLGRWSEAEIVRALRNGQHRNGRLLAPVMPYEWYHEMADDDALAVAVYLKSLPAVRNQVRQSPSVAFRLGKLLFLRPKPEVAAVAPPRSATAEYGGYLARHVGLCADCHTPRRGLRSLPDRRRLFAGMED